MSDFAPPRLDSFDPAPLETTAVPADTAVSDTQPAQTDDKSGLTAEDLALIEAPPDGDETEASETEDADEPGEADEPAEDDDTTSGDDDAAAEAEDEDEAEATDKPTDDIPSDATGYVLPEVAEWEWLPEDKLVLDQFGEVFLEAGIGQSAVNKILETYAARLNAVHEADASHRDERRSALEETWGDKYRTHIKTMRDYVGELPFGDELKRARLPSGKLLLNTEGAAEWLLGIAEARPVERTPEQRLAEINQVRDEDIDRYWRENLDKEYLNLTRTIAAKPASAPRAESEAGLRAELAAIDKLMHADIDQYQNRPWKGSGKTASQRGLEIRRLLAGERAA
jgi:hypothetical protein